MTPSLDIREEAARLHDEMTKAEDEAAEACDKLPPWECWRFKIAQNLYEGFCAEKGLRLLTDASGLFLRCSKTNIPLVDTDECVEGENGELVMVEREVA